MVEYYNVLESGAKVLGFASVGLLMIVVGVTVIILMKKFGSKKPNIVFMYIWTAFGILWTVTAYYSTGSELLECRRVMKNGTYHEVEGVVEDFDPMPHSGHKNESFTVNGVTFEYSDYGASTGFNNTKSHGGPIDEGEIVKIRYYNGLILQLWVRE